MKIIDNSLTSVYAPDYNSSLAEFESRHYPIACGFLGISILSQAHICSWRIESYLYLFNQPLVIRTPNSLIIHEPNKEKILFLNPGITSILLDKKPLNAILATF